MTGGPGNQRALDCGAGIGRITKHLLQRHFLKTDLADQNPKFLERAKVYLQDSGRVGEYFCTGKNSCYSRHSVNGPSVPGNIQLTNF